MNERQYLTKFEEFLFYAGIFIVLCIYFGFSYLLPAVRSNIIVKKSEMRALILKNTVEAKKSIISTRSESEAQEIKTKIDDSKIEAVKTVVVKNNKVIVYLSRK